MARGLVLVATMFAVLSVAHAAELVGVWMPNEQTVDGTHLLLNGIGVRTYSVFGIRIYVAGLYLEQKSQDPDKILDSKGLKLLVMHFVHDVSAEQARMAWRVGLRQNCKRPCGLDPADVQQFLSHVPPAHKGDVVSMLFSPKGARITDDGRLLGNIDDPHFGESILGTFIGPVPPTARLKRELLGLEE
ncbi:MAG TPA: chalcone isomerase family protein [Acetobacteraceae bacterium]|nr:chalcone isomerase family protein [Acetobacteraceae bacterium]